MFISHKEQFQEAEIELYGKSRRYATIVLTYYGRIETVPGVAVCVGGNEWHPEHPGKNPPGAGAAVNPSALQLPVQNRMYLQGAEAADWHILLPLLVKAYVKIKLLAKERGDRTAGAGGRCACL